MPDNVEAKIVDVLAYDKCSKISRYDGSIKKTLLYIIIFNIDIWLFWIKFLNVAKKFNKILL